MMNSNYQSEKHRWRAANAGDPEAVERFINELFDGYESPPKRNESPEFFAKAFNLFPEGCIVQTERNAVIGYGTSYPWPLHDIPPPDNFSVVLPKSPDCLFIEKMSITEYGGISSYIPGHSPTDTFVEMMVEVALRQGFGNLAIVLAAHSHYSRFGKQMARCGFEIATESALNEKLKSYLWQAQYMARQLK
jgi:hypothetical protein